MLAELEEDLVHLEGRGQRLDQNGGPHASGRNAELRLGEEEDFIPEARLEIVFDLGQVKVGARPAPKELVRVVVEVQPEIEEARGDRGPLDLQVSLLEVPTSRSHYEGGGGGPDPVGPTVRGRILDRSADGIDQILLSPEGPAPGGRMGVLEIRHEHAGARIQPVDHHLPIHGSGDLDPAVEEIGRGLGDPPDRLTDRAGLGGETGTLAPGESVPKASPFPEQRSSLRFKAVVEVDQELEGPLGEDGGSGPHRWLPKSNAPPSTGRGRGSQRVHGDAHPPLTPTAGAKGGRLRSDMAGPPRPRGRGV